MQQKSSALAVPTELKVQSVRNLHSERSGAQLARFRKRPPGQGPPMLARYVPALAFVPKFSRMRWQSEVILRREAQFLWPDGEIAQHRRLRLMRGDHLPLSMNFLRRELDDPFLLGLVIEKLASFEIAAPRMIRSHLK